MENCYKRFLMNILNERLIFHQQSLAIQNAFVKKVWTKHVGKIHILPDYAVIIVSLSTKPIGRYFLLSDDCCRHNNQTFCFFSKSQQICEEFLLEYFVYQFFYYCFFSSNYFLLLKKFISFNSLYPLSSHHMHHLFSPFKKSYTTNKFFYIFFRIRKFFYYIFIFFLI